MRKPDQQKLFAEALRLPEEAPAALAEQLLQSLDHPVDPDVEAAWAVEIARRLRELEDGTVQGVPWPEVQKKLRETLQKPR